MDEARKKLEDILLADRLDPRLVRDDLDYIGVIQENTDRIGYLLDTAARKIYNMPSITEKEFQDRFV